MPLAMFHVPPGTQSLDRQPIVQARDVIDSHGTLTELPPIVKRDDGGGVAVVALVLLRRRRELIGGWVGG